MDHFLIILSILAVHLGAVASPGPNFLIVSHNALAGSREAGLATARGITTVAVLYIGGGMLGFAAIVARSPLVFTVVKLLGAAYLIGMGLRTLFTGQHPAPAADHAPFHETITARQAYRSGVLTALSNPKAAIYFLALFTTFVPASMPPGEKVLTAGLLLAISFVWYSFVGWTFSVDRVRQAYWRFARWWNYGFGALWIVLGIMLLMRPH